jgi:methionine-rich copper-binding protein CopC
MPDYITIEHARAVVSHTSKLTENKYSEIVAAANNTEKENLKKTAIGPRMADLKPDEVTLVGAGDKQITKQELADTFNQELTRNGGLALTQKQIDYLWNTSRVVIKDPGVKSTDEKETPANPPAKSETVTSKSEDTVAPTLISSSPSKAATDIAKNSNIDLTFSENIRLADPTKIKLLKKSNDTENDTEVEITTSIENNKILRIKPKADLEASTEYYVTIDSDAVTDTSKNTNAYAGLSFTTGTTTLTSEQQAAAAKAVAGKNKPVSTSEVAPLGSNSFNKPVTKLNLDADAQQSNEEKNLEKLVNLRYGLDLLESKDDVHVALGGNEESYVNTAIATLKSNPPSDKEMDSDYSGSDSYEDDKTPTSPGAFVLKQAIEEYKKIDKTLAAKAEAARDKKINAMAEDEKLALTKVFENYQKKFTKLKEGITEDKLKKYLTDNYDTLKDLEIDDFPKTADKADDITTINGKNKDELITLAVAARNKLNGKIYKEFWEITISAEDKKAFLKKYTDIDFSDSEKSIGFIKELTDKELLLLNKYINSNNAFNSRDFIIRELSQHKLSLENTLGLIPYRLSDDADLISFTDRENLLKKYDPKNTDLTKNKEFIQELTPAELVLLNSSSGFVSKESLLRELDKPENKENKEKSLGDILNAGVVLSYVEGLQSKPLAEIEKIINQSEIKAALKKNTAPLEIGAGFKYSKDSINGELYRLGGSYLVDFGEGKAKFYKNQNQILGLPKDLDSKENYFQRLASDNKSQPGQANPLDLGYDISSDRIYPTSLLRVGENARRVREKGSYKNVLNNILEKIYTSETSAPADQRGWHKQMKQHIARMLLAKDPTEFDQRRVEFQKYLNEADKGISGSGWNIIDAAERASNHADGQTEQMLRDVKVLLNSGVLGS